MNTSSAVVPVRPAHPSQYMTTGQVARRLGYSREQIRRLCVDGKIPAIQIGPETEWRIPSWWLREQVEKTAPIRRKR